MRRAFTLIEVMIVVAMMGIVVTAAVVAPEAPVREAAGVLVRERARQWLDYEADAIARGEAADPKVRAALRSTVRGGELALTKQTDGSTLLEVVFHAPNDRAGRVALVVVRGGT